VHVNLFPERDAHWKMKLTEQSERACFPTVLRIKRIACSSVFLQLIYDD